jgi:hypothetical protein
MGQKIAEQEIIQGENSFQISNGNIGIYFLRFKSSGKTVKLVRSYKG